MSADDPHQLGKRYEAGSAHQRRTDVLVRRVAIIVGGIALALIGAALGGVAALASTHVLRTLLYSVSATDPVAFAGVIVGLCAVALAASYLPARRASRLEPMDVLRGG